jgi:hypothetical protein
MLRLLPEPGNPDAQASGLARQPVSSSPPAKRVRSTAPPSHQTIYRISSPKADRPGSTRCCRSPRLHQECARANVRRRNTLTAKAGLNQVGGLLTIAEADIRVQATSWQLSTASGDETVHVLMSFLYFRRRGVRPLAAYTCALLPPIQLERWCAQSRLRGRFGAIRRGGGPIPCQSGGTRTHCWRLAGSAAPPDMRRSNRMSSRPQGYRTRQ